MRGKIDSVEQYHLTAVEFEKAKSLQWKQVVHSLSYENFLLLNPKAVNRSNRLALMAAIDVPELVGSINSENLQPAYGLIPLNLPGAFTELMSALNQIAILKHKSPSLIIKTIASMSKQRNL